MALEDAADVADGFRNTTSDKTTCEGAPDSVLDCQVQLRDGENCEDGEEGDVGSHIGDVRVPAISLDATRSQSTHIAFESHFVLYK